MAAVANNPAFAKKAGVPQSVGKEFNEADTGRKFSKGGDMKESKAMVGKEMAFMKKKGAPKSMMKHEMAEAGMKKGYADGGMAMVNKGGKMVPSFAADGKGKMAKGGDVKKMMGGGMAYAKGGSVTRADGVVKKGHTKGTQIAMKNGGKC